MSREVRIVLLASALVASSTTWAARRKAALVIGGLDQIQGGTPLDSVELYGCSSNEQYRVDLPALPQGTSNMAAVHIPADDGVSPGQVLICGGFSCDGTCEQTDRCLTFAPGDTDWQDHSTLNEPRWRDILVLSPDIDAPDDDDNLYPLLVGGNQAETTIFDSTGVWRDYYPLPQDDWSSEGCLVWRPPAGDLLYHFGDNVTVLNLNDFDDYDIDEMPEALSPVLR